MWSVDETWKLLKAGWLKYYQDWLVEVLSTKDWSVEVFSTKVFLLKSVELI